MSQELGGRTELQLHAACHVVLQFYGPVVIGRAVFFAQKMGISMFIEMFTAGSSLSILILSSQGLGLSPLALW